MPTLEYPNKKTARIAGLLYLVVVLTGLFSLVYVPANLILVGNPAQIFRSLQDDALLYRLGMMSSLLCYTAFFLLPLVLYRLLGAYGKYAGALMVVFAVVSVPISFMNLIHQFEILQLFHGGDNMKPIPPSQVYAQIVAILSTYQHGLGLSKILWGLWLAPFGYLVFKSDILPRFLGIILMLGCVCYLLESGGGMFLAKYKLTLLADYASLPAAVGEISVCLWLLIVGVREAAVPVPAR